MREAEYFFSRMLDSERDRSAFGYNVSAFLTAARSVLQFALEEAKSRPNGQAWYDKQVTGTQIVGFFKDRRDFNIHREPLNMRKDIQVNIEEGFRLHASAGAVLVRAGEEIPAEAPVASITQEVQAEAPRPARVAVTETYRFSEWNGPEDIKALCRQYLSELEKIILDGQKQGFLT
jgi:hypothetical protein